MNRKSDNYFNCFVIMIFKKSNCKHQTFDIAGNCSGYKVVEGEDNIKDVVAKIGPIAVEMFVSPSFKSYNGG